MAKHVLTDAFVSVNGVDLSDHVESVSYEVGIEAQAANAMSDTQRYSMPGLKTISDIAITYYADFAASEHWATHKLLYVNRSTFPLIVKPTSAADSATNPAFTTDAFIASLGVITGTHGDRHMSATSYAVAGNLTIDET